MQVSELKLLLGHGSELSNAHFEGLSGISVVLSKLLEIVHEDHFPVGVFHWCPFSTESLLPLHEFIFPLSLLSRKMQPIYQSSYCQ